MIFIPFIFHSINIKSHEQSYMQNQIIWMWVKMEDLGDHRCWSSINHPIIGLPNFDPYPYQIMHHTKKHGATLNISNKQTLCLFNIAMV